MLTHSSPLIARLAEIVGERGLIDDPRDMEPYVVDWRGFFGSKGSAAQRGKRGGFVAFGDGKACALRVHLHVSNVFGMPCCSSRTL